MGAAAAEAGSTTDNTDNNNNNMNAPGSSWTSVLFILLGMSCTFFISDMIRGVPEPAAVAGWRARGYFLNTNVDGVDANIFITVYGHDTANETLIILPDAFDSSFSFKNTAEAFERFGVRVILFDFPGFGLSSLPMKDGQISYQDLQTRWLNEVLLSFDHPHVSILAQGTGVVAGALYASEYPQAVESIITYGASFATRRTALPQVSQYTEILEKMHMAFPLAHEPNGCHAHVSDSSTAEELATADAYLATNDGRAQYVHRMRRVLLERPPIDWTDRPRDVTPRLWLGSGTDSSTSGVQSTSLRDSSTEIHSPDICLHHSRPRDFSIIVLAKLRPKAAARPTKATTPRAA